MGDPMQSGCDADCEVPQKHAIFEPPNKVPMRRNSCSVLFEQPAWCAACTNTTRLLSACLNSKLAWCVVPAWATFSQWFKLLCRLHTWYVPRGKMSSFGLFCETRIHVLPLKHLTGLLV